MGRSGKAAWATAAARAQAAIRVPARNFMACLQIFLRGGGRINPPSGSVRGRSAHRTPLRWPRADRKSTRLNSSHLVISYAVFCLKKKNEHRVLVTVPYTRDAISHSESFCRGEA